MGKLKLSFWSKFESWESLELGELKFLFQNKCKVKKVRVWFSQKKVGKVKVRKFAPKATLKVGVENFYFSKLKLDLKLAKSVQL